MWKGPNWGSWPRNSPSSSDDRLSERDLRFIGTPITDELIAEITGETVPPLRPGVPSPVRRWVGAACALAALTGVTVMASGERAAVSLYDLVRCVLLGGMVGAGAVLICHVAAWHVTRLRRTATS